MFNRLARAIRARPQRLIGLALGVALMPWPALWMTIAALLGYRLGDRAINAVVTVAIWPYATFVDPLLEVGP